MKTLFPLAVLTFAILTGGCETDRVRYNIQNPEPVTVPAGLFPGGLVGVPEMARQRIGKMVTKYFVRQREQTAKDPALMFRALAMYEYLINDFQHWTSGVPPYKMVDLLNSREDIRELIGLPKDISANDAINQLYSMSKFMDLAGSQEKIEESDEVSARREVIGKYKAQITLLLKKLKSQQDRETSKINGGIK